MVQILLSYDFFHIVNCRHLRHNKLILCEEHNPSHIFNLFETMQVVFHAMKHTWNLDIIVTFNFSSARELSRFSTFRIQ